MNVRPSSFHLQVSRRTKGVALVTTLAIITIIAALLLSFLITAQLDRQSTFNYSQSIKADELALGALQQVTSSLLQEIDAGSRSDAKYTVDGVRIYAPLTAQTSLPARIGYAATDFATDIDLTGAKLPPTLLQVSRFNATYPAPYDTAKAPSLLASHVSSTAASANGRSISPTRWNKPLFMGDTSSPLSGNQPSQPFEAKPPDWIYITRAGDRICTDAEASAGNLKADPSGANANAVLGRYAYVIYDEGALLDINVAGFPQSAATADPGGIAGKSFVSFADLTTIPSLTQPLLDDLAAWRNKGGLALYPSYTALARKAAAKGFLQSWSDDNPLLSRQDMIDYLTHKSALAAAPYLTTFSRASSAPSWAPSTPAGSSINYASQADTAGQVNRNLANMRASGGFTATHYDDEGNTSTYSIKQGDPLIQRRFSLAKLAWLTHSGKANGISDAAIRACFGLEWDTVNKRWNYMETASAMPSSNVIKTLDVVAAERRAPNFFELLKACILEGSLGRDPGALFSSTTEGVAGSLFESYSALKDGQILRIGASIIDQADVDSYPTAIYCNVSGGSRPVDAVFNTFIGVENLPYLHRLHQILMATIPGRATAPAVSGKMASWLQPELWNPHQVPATTSTLRPNRFRVRTYGISKTVWWQWQDGVYVGLQTSDDEVDYDSGDAAKGIIYFGDAGGSSSIYYNNPVSLTTALVDSAQTDDICLFRIPSSEYPHITGSDASNAFAAIFSGESSVPYRPKAKSELADPNNSTAVFVRSEPSSEITVTLEYDATGNGDWLPYSHMARLRSKEGGSVGWAEGIAGATGLNVVGRSASNLFYIHADPRTDRFSVSEDWAKTENKAFSANKTIWESSTLDHSIWKYWPRTSSGFTYTAGSQRYLGDWQINTTSSRAYYADPDGVVRPADGYLGNNSSGDGRPSYQGGTSSPRRPVILDRPFRSVGELGYVFRDQPYKSLDFWSAESADAALLDAFSVVDEPRAVAGLIHLNNAPKTIIQAVLTGAGKKAQDPGINLGANAVTLAESIATILQTQPISNRADLATQLGAAIQGIFSAQEDKSNKAYAETPVRALAAVSDTRTWNLLIDVIAQSGRMSPSATMLDNFLVEGEKRYWLHLAIDRYTGKIVDQQLEPVYE